MVRMTDQEGTTESIRLCRRQAAVDGEDQEISSETRYRPMAPTDNL